MHERIEKLLAWQDLEQRLFNINKTLLGLPAEAASAKERLLAFQAKVEDAKQGVHDSEKRIKKLQMDIDDLNQKIIDANVKSNDIKDNALYRQMMDSIEQFKERISDIETTELEEMEALDAAKLAQKGAEDDFQAARQAIAGEVKDLKTRAENCAKQIKNVEGARDEAATHVDPELLKVAQRLVARTVPGKRFNAALVPIHNGNCGGCHMKLTANSINDARKGSGKCDTCGAIIYHEK
jgi:predicted  nucleic acid-binding Zn-ribbon protein